MFQDLTTLVLDIGTCKTRIGYGGDEAPKVDVPSQIAYAAAMEESEKNIKAGNKYLSLDRSDFEIESIFQSSKDGSQASIQKENYCHFVDFLLNNELQVKLSDYSLLFSEDINQNQS